MDTSPCTGKEKKRKSASSENAGLSKRFVNEREKSLGAPPCTRYPCSRALLKLDLRLPLRMANQRRARKNQSKTNQRINRDNKHSRESAEEEETLNCTCQRPYVDGELVVCCDACTEWFHPTCVALSHEEAEALPVFVCPGCLEEAAAATASAEKRKLANKFREAHLRYVQQKRQRRYEHRQSVEAAAAALRTHQSSSNSSSGLAEDPLVSRCGVSVPPERVVSETASAPKKRRRPSANEASPASEPGPAPEQESTPVSPKKKRVSGDGKPVEPIRQKARQMLYEALRSPVAYEIESALFELMDHKVHDDYRARLRNLVANLRDQRNDELREAVISGSISPSTLCQMNSEELACKELRIKRQEQLTRAEKLRVIESAEQVGLIFKEVPPANARDSDDPETIHALDANIDTRENSSEAPKVLPSAETAEQGSATRTLSPDAPLSPAQNDMIAHAKDTTEPLSAADCPSTQTDTTTVHETTSATTLQAEQTHLPPRLAADLEPVRCFQENAFTVYEAEPLEAAHTPDDTSTPESDPYMPVTQPAPPYAKLESETPALPSSLQVFQWHGKIATGAAPAFKPVLYVGRNYPASMSELTRLAELLGGHTVQLNEMARIRQRDALAFIRDVRERSSSRRLLLFHVGLNAMDTDAAARCLKAVNEFRKRDRASLLMRNDVLELYLLPVTDDTAAYLDEVCNPDGALLACVVRRDALEAPLRSGMNVDAGGASAEVAQPPGFDISLALQILSRQYRPS